MSAGSACRAEVRTDRRGRPTELVDSDKTAEEEANGDDQERVGDESVDRDEGDCGVKGQGKGKVVSGPVRARTRHSHVLPRRTS